MFRFILVCIFLFSYLLLGIPVLLVEWIIGFFNRPLRDRSSLQMVQWAFKCILKIVGLKLTVIGEENVPKDEAVLYVANHRSYFDILITYSRVPRLTGYIAKKEMLRYPLLNTWMKYLYCLFLDRTDLKQGMKIILQGIDYIKHGISVFIFPEGTRNRTDTMLPFKEGSLKIAEKSGCAIIPVALTNSAAIFENHIPFMKPARVILEYGKPFYPGQLSKEDKKRVGAYTQKRIQEMLDAHKKMMQ